MRDYRVHALVIAYIYACVCIYIYILYFSKKRKQITRPNWRHRGQRNLAKLSKKLRPLSLSSIAHFPFSFILLSTSFFQSFRLRFWRGRISIFERRYMSHTWSLTCKLRLITKGKFVEELGADIGIYIYIFRSFVDVRGGDNYFHANISSIP